MAKSSSVPEQIIIIGAGGHAKVLLNALQVSSRNVLGLTDTDPQKHGSTLLGCPVLGDDAIIDTYDHSDVRLIIGIGSTKPGSTRRDAFEHFQAKGFRFSTCVHPSATVAPDIELGQGSQVMAGAVIQPGCKIGMNTIINTRASVDHDCHVSDHVHIAPGAILGGSVSIGHGSHIGTHATIIENITIGSGAMIAASACVVANLKSQERVAGIPAKPF